MTEKEFVFSLVVPPAKVLAFWINLVEGRKVSRVVFRNALKEYAEVRIDLAKRLA